MFHGTAHVILGLGPDHRRRDVLPALHPAALLPDPGHPAGHRHAGRGGRRPDPRAGGHHRRQPVRAAGAQAHDADTRAGGGIGTAVVRWPGPILVATIALSLIGLLALPGYKTNYDDRHYLPPDLPGQRWVTPPPNGTSRRPG